MCKTNKNLYISIISEEIIYLSLYNINKHMYTCCMCTFFKFYTHIQYKIYITDKALSDVERLFMYLHTYSQINSPLFTLFMEIKFTFYVF